MYNLPNLQVLIKTIYFYYWYKTVLDYILFSFVKIEREMDEGDMDVGGTPHPETYDDDNNNNDDDMNRHDMDASGPRSPGSSIASPVASPLNSAPPSPMGRPVSPGWDSRHSLSGSGPASPAGSDARSPSGAEKSLSFQFSYHTYGFQHFMFMMLYKIQCMKRI